MCNSLPLPSQAFLWRIHGHQAPDRVPLLHWPMLPPIFLMPLHPSPQVPLSHEDLDSPVSAVGWSNDGQAFALGLKHHILHLYNLSQNHHWSFRLQSMPPVPCAGHDDGKVSLWGEDGVHRFTWWPHEAPVTGIAIMYALILFFINFFAFLLPFPSYFLFVFFFSCLPFPPIAFDLFSILYNLILMPCGYIYVATRLTRLI